MVLNILRIINMLEPNALYTLATSKSSLAIVNEYDLVAIFSIWFVY